MNDVVVLLEDADVELRCLLTILLEGAGYHVLITADSACARDALLAVPCPMVALLVLTPALPPARQRVFGLLRHAVHEPLLGRHGYVVATTDLEGLSEVEWRALAALDAHVLQVPFSIRALLTTVDDAAKHTR